MALTPSNMLKLGTSAPNFKLLDSISNKELDLQILKSDTATVIMFICNHCPFVKFINEKLVELSTQYLKKGIAFIAINSNDTVKYPEDSFENMTLYAKKLSYNFPYLFDEDQSIAKAYDAACTPDFFIFDKNLKLVYRGQMDDSRPSNGQKPTGKDLINALNALIKGEKVSTNQKPSIGCNIKWK